MAKVPADVDSAPEDADLLYAWWHMSLMQYCDDVAYISLLFAIPKKKVFCIRSMQA